MIVSRWKMKDYKTFKTFTQSWPVGKLVSKEIYGLEKEQVINID
jgi:hypothetical protein